MALRTARILAACDAAAALILAGWDDRGADDTVTRDWIPEINLTEDAEPVHVGRRLYVIPAPDAYTADLITRNDQQRNYKFRVLMVERYLPADENAATTPSRDWIDERVNFFEQRVFNVLANQGTVLLDELVPAIEETATVQVILDRDVLLQHRTFWAWAEFPYVEDTDINGEVHL
jgi:hypothetical protein